MRVPLFALQIESNPRALALGDLGAERFEQRLNIGKADSSRGRRGQDALQDLALMTVQGLAL